MANVDNTVAKVKLAKFVNEHMVPSIAQFFQSLSDEEIVDLLGSFKVMNIDLMRDLTNAAKERKIQSNQWTEDSPFDAFMEGGIADKEK